MEAATSGSTDASRPRAMHNTLSSAALVKQRWHLSGMVFTVGLAHDVPSESRRPPGCCGRRRPVAARVARKKDSSSGGLTTNSSIARHPDSYSTRCRDGQQHFGTFGNFSMDLTAPCTATWVHIGAMKSSSPITRPLQPRQLPGKRAKLLSTRSPLFFQIAIRL